jgi:hypothetical protein
MTSPAWCGGCAGVTAQGMVFRPSVAPFLAAQPAEKPPRSSFLVPELFCYDFGVFTRMESKIEQNLSSGTTLNNGHFPIVDKTSGTKRVFAKGLIEGTVSYKVLSF